MNISIRKHQHCYFVKAISISLIVCFSLLSMVPVEALAQTVPLQINPISPLSPVFTPTLVRGIRVYPDNPFQFDFIVDSGDTGLKGEDLKKESERLIRYFLASLTVPEDDLWVNLSPYESDRIVPDELGKTEMGIDMLAQDYLLKQITASLTNPESDIGKEFWQKIYKQSYEKFGTTNVPVDTFNKVWIMPDKAEVYVQEDKAFIVESRLKVMLESDYLAMEKNQGLKDQRIKGIEDVPILPAGSQSKRDNAQKSKLQDPDTFQVRDKFAQADLMSADGLHKSGAHLKTKEPRAKSQELTSRLVREVFIPVLEQEVNTGKNFAQLRQIYHSLILAHWYKTALKDSILNKVYSDQKKIEGLQGQRIIGVKEGVKAQVSSGTERQNNLTPNTSNMTQSDPSNPLILDSSDPQTEVQSIYNQYLNTFKQGVHDMIKVEYDPYTQKHIPRKYFAGGVRGFGQEIKPTILNSDTSEGQRAGSAIMRRFRQVTTIVLISLGLTLFGSEPVALSDPGASDEVAGWHLEDYDFDIGGFQPQEFNDSTLKIRTVQEPYKKLLKKPRELNVVSHQTVAIGEREINIYFVAEPSIKEHLGLKVDSENIYIYLGTFLEAAENLWEYMNHPDSFIGLLINAENIKTDEQKINFIKDWMRSIVAHELVHAIREENPFSAEETEAMRTFFLKHGLSPTKKMFDRSAQELEAYAAMLAVAEDPGIILAHYLLTAATPGILWSNYNGVYAQSSEVLSRLGYEEYVLQWERNKARDEGKNFYEDRVRSAYRSGRYFHYYPLLTEFLQIKLKEPGLIRKIGPDIFNEISTLPLELVDGVDLTSVERYILSQWADQKRWVSENRILSDSFDYDVLAREFNLSRETVIAVNKLFSMGFNRFRYQVNSVEAWKVLALNLEPEIVHAIAQDDFEDFYHGAMKRFGLGNTMGNFSDLFGICELYNMLAQNPDDRVIYESNKFNTTVRFFRDMFPKADISPFMSVPILALSHTFDRAKMENLIAQFEEQYSEQRISVNDIFLFDHALSDPNLVELLFDRQALEEKVRTTIYQEPMVERTDYNMKQPERKDPDRMHEYTTTFLMGSYCLYNILQTQPGVMRDIAKLYYADIADRRGEVGFYILKKDGGFIVIGQKSFDISDDHILSRHPFDVAFYSGHYHVFVNENGEIIFYPGPSAPDFEVSAKDPFFRSLSVVPSTVEIGEGYHLLNFDVYMGSLKQGPIVGSVRNDVQVMDIGTRKIPFHLDSLPNIPMHDKQEIKRIKENIKLYIKYLERQQKNRGQTGMIPIFHEDALDQDVRGFVNEGIVYHEDFYDSRYLEQAMFHAIMKNEDLVILTNHGEAVVVENTADSAQTASSGISSKAYQNMKTNDLSFYSSELAMLLGRIFPGSATLIEHLGNINIKGGDYYDVGTGGGRAPEEANTKFPNIKTYASDVLNRLPDSFGYKFKQGKIQEVVFYKDDGSPALFDVITLMRVLQYSDDPLGDIVHVYNLLKAGGILATVSTIPEEQVKFFELIERTLRELEIPVLMQVTSVPGQWTQKDLGLQSKKDSVKIVAFVVQKKGNEKIGINERLSVTPRALKLFTFNEKFGDQPRDYSYKIVEYDGLYEKFDRNDFGPIDLEKLIVSFVSESENEIADKREVAPGTQLELPFPDFAQAPGGIDFSAETMPLNTQGQNIDFAMPMDFESLTSQDVQGLVPVIINILPVTNLPLLLGIHEDPELEQLSLVR